MAFSRPGTNFFAQVSGISSRVFKVLEVRLSTGATLLDHAVVAVDLGDPKVQQYVQNVDLSTLTFTTFDQGSVSLQGAEMSIVAENNGVLQAVHWGKVSVQEIDMGSDEGIKLVSRLEETHFGKPLWFQHAYDPISQSIAYLDHDVVFNPEIKKVIVGNMRVAQSAAGQPNLGYNLFLDPASSETVNAANFQRARVTPIDDPAFVAENVSENWNLIEAVMYLCGECNPSGPITNPTFEELSAVLSGDRRVLKNHTIRNGLYLPEALEALLEPYGYTFRIEYTTPTSRKIVILQNGVGSFKEVKWQAAGSVLDLAQQEADQIQLQYDTSMACNAVTAMGSFAELEATWYLKPAWLESQDETSLKFLKKNGPFWETNPEYHRVWRDWVLDEAGDYGRAWGDQPANTANTHLSEYFTAAFNTPMTLVPKRRKFHPMLTRGSDGQPYGITGGCKVEWWRPNKPGGAGWEVLYTSNEMFNCRLLEHECGISFTGSSPPMMIRKQRSNAKIRITATVRSDTRIIATADSGNSVNKDTHRRQLDVNQRFHARLLHADSVYFTDVQTGKKTADVVDGRSALAEFANDAVEAWDQAQCSGSIRLEGCDHLDYKLGDLIQRVVGRNVSFQLNSAPGSQARYPQVVGITYYVQDQKTHLTINEFKETDAFVASFLRKTRRLK